MLCRTICYSMLCGCLLQHIGCHSCTCLSRLRDAHIWQCAAQTQSRVDVCTHTFPAVCVLQMLSHFKERYGPVIFKHRLAQKLTLSVHHNHSEFEIQLYVIFKSGIFQSSLPVKLKQLLEVSIWRRCCMFYYITTRRLANLPVTVSFVFLKTIWYDLLILTLLCFILNENLSH